MKQQQKYKEDYKKLFEEEDIRDLSQDKLRGFQLGNFQTDESEWKVILGMQEFERDEEMYKIEIIDSEGKTGELVVSEEHKVYAIEEINYNVLSSIKSSKSLVEYALTKNCSVKCGSFDQIAESTYNPNAIYGESSISLRDFIALLRNRLYSLNLTNLTESSTSFCLISNSCSDNPDLTRHSFLCSSNSYLINSGAKKLALISENKYELTESGFINEKNILLSNMRFIVYSDNFLNLPFFALFPKSTDHSTNSCSSFELNFLSNCCFKISRLADSNISLDKSKLNFSANSLKLSGKSIHISAMEEPNNRDYKKLSVDDFNLKGITEVYSSFENGSEIYFLDSESNHVKIKSIERVPYSGKIYDV